MVRNTYKNSALLLCLAGCLLGAGASSAAADAPEAKGKQLCHVKCTDPHAACKESQKVIDTLNDLVKAMNEGDFSTVGEYMDENVTTFDEDSKKLLCGREAVLAEMKKRYEKAVAQAGGGTVSYHIEQPYAQVSGDRATVTFLLRKTISGKTPICLESHSTDVFVKHEGKWKKLHYRGSWKKVSPRLDS